MKKYRKLKAGFLIQAPFLCLLLSIFILQNSTTYAQQVEVKKKEVPAAVVKAVESDYMSCKDNITWQIMDEASGVDYYVARASGKNIKCEAVYDAEGNLISAKTILKNMKLSAEIQESLSANYPGWKVSGDQVVVRNFDQNIGYTEITLVNKGERKTVYFNTRGKETTPDLALNVPKVKVSKRNIPRNVTKAVNSDYLSCGGKKVSWYKHNRGGDANEYIVTATGKNIKCEATYDAMGRLISSKTVATNVKLPLNIAQSIYKDYPDWTITEDQMVIRNFDESTKYYQVVIAKEGDEQTLYFDSKGNKAKKPKNSI